MPTRKQICSQQIHCLSCPLSIKITGKECQNLTAIDIQVIMKGAEKMYINGEWKSETEVQAYVSRLENKIPKYDKAISRDIELIDWLRTMPQNRWISVEDKLPIECGPVLCFARSTTGEGNFRILGTLRNGEFWFLQVDGTQFSFPNLHLEVTHWMPLPDPPADGGNEDENT